MSFSSLKKDIQEHKYFQFFHKKKRISIILLVSLLLLFFLISFILPVSQKPKTGSSSTPVEKVAALNKKIMQTNAEYNNSSTGEKAAQLAKLNRLAKQREKLMLDLMQNQPAKALTVVFTENERNKLNPKIQKLVEHKTNTEGILQMMQISGIGKGKTTTVYLLSNKNNNYDNVTFADKMTKKPVTQNQKFSVSLNGIQLDKTIVVPTSNSLKIQSRLINTKNNVLAASTTRTIKVAFLPVNLSNAVVSSNLIPIAKQRMPVVNAYYKEQSYGLVNVQGKSANTYADYLPPVTIAASGPANGFDCFSGNNWSTVLGWLMKGKSAAGSEVNGYNTIVYLMPPICTASLGAEFGDGSAHDVVFATTNELNGLEHELGHSLLLQHASTYLCGNKSFGTNCTQNAYGDLYTVMGAATRGHFNAYEKEKVGWFSASNVQTVTKSGTYKIAPIEKPASAVQALKIPDGSSKYYYIEFRQPYGFDKLADFNHQPLTSSNVFQGVLIHIAPMTTNGDDVTLINANPQVSDFTDAALTTGESIYDPATKTAFQTVSINSSAATVKIGINASGPFSAPKTSPAPNPSGITPTYNTLGDCQANGICPSTSPKPSTNTQQPLTGTPAKPSIPTTPSITLSPGPSGSTGTTPCATSQSSVSSQSTYHGKHHARQINGLLRQLIQIILQFIIFLLQQIGIQIPSITLPCTPTITTPSGTPGSSAGSPSKTPPTAPSAVPSGSSSGSGGQQSPSTAVSKPSTAPGTGTGSGSGTTGNGTLSPLHVSGNKLVDAAGKTVLLHGVDYMGTEYMCEGGGIFDNGGFGPNNNTPPGANFISALKSWKVNAVRIPTAEDCWLNINGVATGGSTYQQGIVAFVNELNKNNIYAIVDLHWAHGGSTVPKQQYGMADTDHSPAFWSSVANTFKGNNNVIFDLYNEPTIGSWSCWENGGCQTDGYAVAGMQQLLNSVRSAGAKNVVMIGGLSSANDLTGWLSHEPKDTLNPPQIAASWHTYDSSVTWNCSTSNLSCMQQDWTNNLGGVPAKVPVIVGEFGEFDCSSTYVDQLMPFMDQQGMSYLAWTFNPAPNCSNGPYLITNASGTPTSNGAGIKAHYLKVNP